jgi:hypothetical protein
VVNEHLIDMCLQRVSEVAGVADDEQAEKEKAVDSDGGGNSFGVEVEGEHEDEGDAMRQPLLPERDSFFDAWLHATLRGNAIPEGDDASGDLTFNFA